jgi:UDP-3-O-[3-hydroxymyristoyl] glucosamine N-acyltransferase
MKKFKLTTNTKVNALGITLFQIECTVAIEKHRIKVGDLGGWVESEYLSNGNARVSGNAWVSGNALVSGDAQVSGNALVSDNARVSGDAQVSGNAWVSGNALVSGDAQVYGDALVSGDAQVSGDARVSDNARVSGDAWVSGNAWVSDNALVSGDAQVYGNALVSGDARVSENADYCCFQSFGSSNRTTTFHKDVKIVVRVNCGCFTGSIDDFIEKVNTTHGDNILGKTYQAIIAVAKLKFRL